MDQLTERGIYLNRTESAFHQIRDFQQCEHRLVAVVRQQISGLGDTFRIDRILFEYADGSKSDGRSDNQRDEQFVTA